MSHIGLSWLPIKGTSWPGICPLRGEAEHIWVLSKHTESELIPLLSEQMGTSLR